MEVIWDEEKNESNFDKHGVWFQEAATIFMDSNRESFEDKDHDEERFIAVGFSHKARLLTVAYTYDEEAFRIISAMRTTPKEREKYEERI